MSFTWYEIHEHLLRTSSTLHFQHDFDAICRRHQPLIRFRDPAGLLDALHRGSAAPDLKNLLLAALIKAAQSDRPEADCALTLSVLALWPGLDAVFRRAKCRRLGTPDDLASEILARAIEAVRCLELSRVNRIAATVLRNIERDLVRVRQKEAERMAFRAETDPDELAADTCESNPGRLLQALLIMTGTDATLVVRVAAEGFSQAEVAVELGLSEAAGRKRYQRSIRRLRAALHEFV